MQVADDAIQNADPWDRLLREAFPQPASAIRLRVAFDQTSCQSVGGAHSPWWFGVHIVRQNNPLWEDTL